MFDGDLERPYGIAANLAKLQAGRSKRFVGESRFKPYVRGERPICSSRLGEQIQVGAFRSPTYDK